MLLPEQSLNVLNSQYMPRGMRAVVVGAGSMAGYALLRSLESTGCDRVVGTLNRDITYPVSSRHDAIRLEVLEPRHGAEVRRMFLRERPTHVFLASSGPCPGDGRDTVAQFLQRSLATQVNVLQAAFEAGVDRLVLVGAANSIPAHIGGTQGRKARPAGPPPAWVEARFSAVIKGGKLCECYNRHHGTRFATVIAPEVYGPGTCFDTAGVVQLFMQRFLEARATSPNCVVLKHSPCARHELLHVNDLAAACMLVMSLPDSDLQPGPIEAGDGLRFDAGGGRHFGGFELARLVANVAGYDGKVIFDVPRETEPQLPLLDASRLKSLGWCPQVDLTKGLAAMRDWHIAHCRAASRN